MFVVVIITVDDIVNLPLISFQMRIILIPHERTTRKTTKTNSKHRKTEQ